MWQHPGMETPKDRLNAIMASRHLGVRKLASMSGVSPGAISNIRSGNRKDPEVQTLALLAKALDVRVEWLAFGAGPATEGTSIDETTEAALLIARTEGGVDDETINEFMAELESRGERLSPRRLIDALIARYDAKRFAMRAPEDAQRLKRQPVATPPALPSLEELKRR